MLRTENLDDQTFAEIVEEAVKSIPTVFPEWTDHNAHDPGITLQELFAWYKVSTPQGLRPTGRHSLF